MIKRLLVTLIFVFAAFAHGEEEQKPEPLDEKYMSEHRFVIVSKASSLYASNLPGYNKPRNYQLIAKISASIPAVTHLVRDAETVTMRTKAFNLQRLARGESFSVTAKVYMGHLDQGGMTMYEDVTIEFDETLYSRLLTDIEPSSNRHIYDEVKTGSSGRILVHRIQQAPSYDHLVLAYDNNSCLLDFVFSSPTPNPGAVLQRMLPCGSLKPLYYNTDVLE